jgi:3-phosphoshikimate 1-carboxyvinyltransferase
MTTELRNMGVEIEEHPDGMSIYGPVKLRGAALEGYNDHRVAMALSVASLIAEGQSTLHGRSAVDISFPGFFDKLKALSKG